MSARAARRPVKPNKLALGLAAGTSAALGTAAVTGYDLGAAEVVGAFAVAGTIGAISIHASRPERQQPHVRKPVQSSIDGPVVRAPKARNLAAQPTGHSDAA